MFSSLFSFRWMVAERVSASPELQMPPGSRPFRMPDMIVQKDRSSFDACLRFNYRLASSGTKL
jgi:hypothetical protein